MKNAVHGLKVIIQVLFGALPLTIAALPFLLGHLVGMMSLGVAGMLEHLQLFLHGVAVVCGAAGAWLTIAQQLDGSVMRRPLWRYIISAMLVLGLFECGYFVLLLGLILHEEGRGAIVLLLSLATIVVMSWQLSMQVRGIGSRRRLTLIRPPSVK